MFHRPLRFGLLLALSLSAAASAQSLQSRIDAAAPGDTLFVGPSASVETVTIDKSLRLIGSGSATTSLAQPVPIGSQTLAPALRIHGLSASESVEIHGIAILARAGNAGLVGALTIEDCDGAVVCSDLTVGVTGTTQTIAIGGLAVVSDSHEVLLTECEFGPGPLASGVSGMECLRSNVAMNQTRVRGSNGGPFFGLSTGSNALRVEGGVVRAAASEFDGGNGGISVFGDSGRGGLGVVADSAVLVLEGSAICAVRGGTSPGGVYPGLGGSAISLNQSTLRYAQDVVLASGRDSGGQVTQPTIRNTASQVHLVPRQFGLTLDPVRPGLGGIATLTAHGEPGASSVILLSFGVHRSVDIPGVAGPVWVGPMHVALPPMTLSSMHTASLVLDVPNLPALTGLTCSTQALGFRARFELSVPATFTFGS